MPGTTIPTDETLRSQLDYGNTGFPFACYMDHLMHYESSCIEWHWHSEFEFSFVKEGTVTCHIGANCIKLSAGDAIFINSETIHRFESEDSGVLVNYIFLPDFIADRTSVIYGKYVQPFLDSDLEYSAYLQQNASVHNNDIVEALKKTYSIVYSDYFGKELRIRDSISNLWLAFAKCSLEGLDVFPKSRNKTLQARLHEMMTYIFENFEKHLTLADISFAAKISKSEALRCFRIGLETTPVKYLNEYRLSRAVEQLLLNSSSVASVAEACGFESAGYFCRAFKAKYGLSPNEFRKANMTPHKFEHEIKYEVE